MNSIILVFSLSSIVGAAPQWRAASQAPLQKSLNVQLGVRPYYLVNDMDPGPLKDKLQSCSEGPFQQTDFSFSHRGAPLQFPEHTKESYQAAIRQGAGVIECDVTFTKDKQLVCRHSQCDLHTTTNILSKPDLAARCTQPFQPYNAATGIPASANCCTSDITLAEFKSLCGKMDSSNPNATTPAQYQTGTPPFRTDLYSTCGTLLTLKEYIALVDSYGLKFTPELKTPIVSMPYQGWTQQQYAQTLIDEFKTANITPERVFPQSYLPDDIYYWLEAEPAFGKQAIYLDERVNTPEGYANATASMAQLAKTGVKIVAPAFFALTELGGADNRTVVPSEYSVAAKKAGLDIVTWSFERSGFLNHGGDSYYQYVRDVINSDGDMYTILDVLVHQVGIKAIFSDWPATVVYYANCFGLK